MRVQVQRPQGIGKALQSIAGRPLRPMKRAPAAFGSFGGLMAALRVRRRRALAPAYVPGSVLSLALGGALIGIGLMYYLDPSYGRRRRALMRDKLVRARHLAQQGAIATRNDFKFRAQGLVAEAKSYFRSESPADDVIEARVRSKLGYVCSHPHAVVVKVDRGAVWLSGHILQRELGRVLRSAGRVRGVTSVQHDLQSFEEPGSVPDLQGGIFRRGRRFELLQDNWAPSARVFAGLTGLALVSYGLSSRKASSPIAVLGGVALTARSLGNMPMRSLFGIREARGIEIVKTVHVKAPIDEVFRYWHEPENLPKFMEHIKAVHRLGDGKVAWELKGPLDSSVSAETTLVSSPSEHVMMWQSTERSAIGMNGILRFEQESGGTRLHLRMTYSPPVGAVGHAFIKLLRADPKRDLDDDMIRFKSLVEHGKATVHGRAVSRAELGVSP